MTDEIVGRANERAELDEFLGAVPMHSRGLVLEGEPGIGKTRLWRAGTETAAACGYAVLVARPAAAEAQLPYGTLGDLLEGVRETELAALPVPQRMALETALLLTETAGPVDQRALGLGFLGVLRVRATARPVILAIDDLHWVDSASARAIDFALRRLGSDPIGLLAARRPPGSAADVLVPELAFTEDCITIAPVGPLTLGAIYELLHSRLGMTLPRPTLRQVHEASGGNPFYALEFGRALQRRGHPLRLDATELPIPPSLQELVHERLAQLPESVHSVLGALALLPEATVPVVQASCRDADAALDAAVAEGVVETDGTRLRFTHPLLAAGALSLLDRSRRQALHARLAQSAHDPLDRVRHRGLAAARPDAGLAADLDEAAKRAVGRGSADLSVELGTLAVDLTPAELPEERNRRRLELAVYHYRTGAVAQMREELEALVAELPPGRQRALALRWLAVSRDDDFEAAVELCEQAREEADDDLELLYEIESFLPILWIVRGDVAAAATHAGAALAAAEQLGDDARLAVAITLHGLLETWLGNAPVALIERGVELESGLGPLPDFYGSPTITQARRFLYVGQLDEARSDFESSLRLAVERGDEPSQIGAHLALSELECRAGDWDDATAHARAGYELAEQHGALQGKAGMLYARALVDAHCGRVTEARAGALRAIEQSEQVKSGLFSMQSTSVLGFLELSLGRFEEADAHLSALPARLDRAGYREPGVCPCLPNAVEAALGVHDVDRARGYTDQLEQQARAAKNSWALAASLRCRGLVLSAAGEIDGALAALDECVQAHEALPMPFELGRAKLALGIVQRRAARKRDARDSLQAALTLFEELGAPLWAHRAQSELSRIGGRAAPRRGELTETEQLIADLVAVGRTNGEVAAELSLSARTVQWNLTKIYRKLGVRSRTELAASLSVGDAR